MKALINFFFEIGVLRRLKRSYHLQVLDAVESVAEHSHRAMIIAYFMAKHANADASKTMLMTAFHDMTETRVGDSNWVQKQYISQNEEQALNDQLAPLGELGDELRSILREYKLRESVESKIAKDADNVEYYMSLRELEIGGNLEAKRRLESDRAAKLDNLYTEAGKELVRIIKETHPTEWTWEVLRETSKRYKID